MKVLITAPSLDENRNVSGISTVVRQIIKYSAFKFDHFEAGRQGGEESRLLWLAGQLVLPVRFLQRIRSFSPDVVHINTGMTWLAVCRDAVLGMAARFAGRPVVLSVHGGRYLVEPFASGLMERIAGQMLRRSRSVLVLSELERNLLLKRWPDLSIDVLPNAVPTDVSVERDGQNELPVLIYFGRMHESKGIGEIIEATKILKAKGSSFVFRAYGDGPERERFVGEMRQVLGESFEDGGVVSGDEKWQKLAAADIFLLPSRYGEGLPMALLEAMAAGCVVVTSDNASITTVVSDGENGYIVEPENARQLAETLGSLLNDRTLWKPVQLAAAATVRDRFGIDSYIAKIDSIYSDAARTN